MNEVTAMNMTDAVTQDVKSLIENSIQGQEQAYQSLLKLAIKATFPTDWIAMGDKPFLQQAGVARIALRFGVSIKFDRDNTGNLLITREDFETEHGRGYMYTVCGKAVVGTREFEAIGTASTQDQFLGMENVYDQQTKKKTGTRAVPLHEAMQDAKKKAVTNFYNNAISQIIGIKGLTWDKLAEYGIGQGGKSTVDYTKKTGAKPIEKVTLPVIDKGMPMFISEFKGTNYLHAKTGSHFSEKFLITQGMKASKTPGTFTAAFTDSLYQALVKQATEADMNQEAQGD